MLDLQAFKKKFLSDELKALAEMSVFCGLVVSIVVLVLTRSVWDDVIKGPMYGALVVLNGSILWIVFFRHMRSLNVQYYVLPFHFLLFAGLGLAVWVEDPGERTFDLIPLFGCGIILVMLCPFRAWLLWACVALYTAGTAIAYVDGPRYAYVVSLNGLGFAITAAFREVYHRWSLQRGLRIVEQNQHDLGQTRSPDTPKDRHALYDENTIDLSPK